MQTKLAPPTCLGSPGTFPCSATGTGSIREPRGSLEQPLLCPCRSRGIQQGCPAPACVPILTVCDTRPAEPARASRVCRAAASRAAAFAALSVFPLQAGQTLPVISPRSMNPSGCSAVSQHCHSDALTDVLAEFCHVVLVPFFVLCFILTCALF